MSWDNILMIFVDILLNSDKELNDFYVTRSDIMKFTDLNEKSVSNNLSVLVKNGWLKRVELWNGNCSGREVRYYINNFEIINFVNKFLR